jgi:CHAD domain-containing protein
MPRLGEHGTGLLRQQTKALVHWHGPVLENRDPEPLHQMRVSMRRLRTTLEQFGPALVLPKGVTAERVAKPLRRLGMARDLDVLGQRLEQGLLPQLPKAEAKQLKPVFKQLRRERELAHGAVVATLQSSSYLALVAQLQGWLKDPQFSAWGESPLDGWVWELQLPAIGELFVHPGWLVAELGDQGEAIHGLRIAIKRARYGLETISPMAGPGTRRWIGRFKAAQDVLGELNDGEVLRRAIDSQIPQGLEQALPQLQVLLDQQRQELWQQWRLQAGSLNTSRQRRSLLKALLADQARLQRLTWWPACLGRTSAA